MSKGPPYKIDFFKNWKKSRTGFSKSAKNSWQKSWQGEKNLFWEVGGGEFWNLAASRFETRYKNFVLSIK